MPNTTLPFTFDMTAQGLTDQGTNPKISAAWQGTDGVPAGSYAFTSALVAPILGELSAIQPIGTTWETNGVISGSTVTTAQLVSFYYRLASGAGLLLDMDIVDNAGVSVLTSLLRNRTLGGAPGFPWQIGVAGGSVLSVLSASQPSSSPARLKLTYNPNNSGGTGQVLAVDSLMIDVAFTPGSGGGGTTTPGGLTQPPPNGGVWLADGTFIPGTQVCGAGVADIYTLLGEIRQGYQ